ncbi:hypothetical protein HMP0015_2083, partial [Acinetobacter haemolyticus ATCC 19194]
MWQIDASVCVVFYLNKKAGLHVMDEREFYKNKPANLKKIEKDRVIRYVQTDHTSGSFYHEYFWRSENVENLTNFFFSCIQQRSLKEPMHGVPFILYVDKGTANTSGMFRNLLERLDVEFIAHATNNSRAKGQVAHYEKSANQHEAATALCQAQSLMEKYNIDADDAELLGIVDAEILGSGSQKPPVFESMLAQSIAKLMDCKVFLSYQINKTASTPRVVAVWHFTGFDPAPEIASYAFDVLYRQLKKARTTFINTNLKRVQIRANKVKRADMFCEGWVIEASEQARRIKPNTEKLQQIEAHIKKTTKLTTFKPKNRNEKTRDSSRSRNDYWS